MKKEYRDNENKPVLSSAKTASGKTTVAGKLVNTPNQAYTIEFYSSPKDTNEGKKFIGEKGITTSVDGLRSFTFTRHIGHCGAGDNGDGHEELHA